MFLHLSSCGLLALRAHRTAILVGWKRLLWPQQVFSCYWMFFFEYLVSVWVKHKKMLQKWPCSSTFGDVDRAWTHFSLTGTKSRYLWIYNAPFKCSAASRHVDSRAIRGAAHTKNDCYNNHYNHHCNDHFIANDVSIHTDDWERQVAPSTRCAFQPCGQLRKTVTCCTFNCWETNKQTKNPGGMWVYDIFPKRKVRRIQHPLTRVDKTHFIQCQLSWWSPKRRMSITTT